MIKIFNAEKCDTSVHYMICLIILSNFRERKVVARIYYREILRYQRLFKKEVHRSSQEKRSNIFFCISFQELSYCAGYPILHYLWLLHIVEMINVSIQLFSQSPYGLDTSIVLSILYCILFVMPILKQLSNEC